ncbi:helix-turn-helix domain-containing protein [Candidatus Formimonas warabiya]|uniref:HTH cro/C1-type domain-containing protein n=1 Tax=Formimonas warabiya TaxID=1761012 RepID=A0A3G1KTM6_FORW1|nr:XRE family transcriptional regulator [Candidatus Formimonas warabiya]ATW25505.1 hypothetical protein DCMF_12640 [Candidatus Formimonas warabiya]
MSKQFGDLIKQARLKEDLSLRDLAGLCTGISFSYINKLEKGLYEPSRQVVLELAKALGLSPDKVLITAGYAADRIMEAQTNIYQPAGAMAQIPVLGVIRMGQSLYAEENLIGYEWIPEREIQGGEFFFFQVKGDAMEPQIPEGSRVLIRKQEDIKSGEMGLVFPGEGEAVLRKVIYGEDYLVLQSLNPKYPLLVCKAGQIGIIGRAKKVVFDL